MEHNLTWFILDNYGTKVGEIKEGNEDKSIKELVHSVVDLEGFMASIEREIETTETHEVKSKVDGTETYYDQIVEYLTQCEGNPKLIEDYQNRVSNWDRLDKYEREDLYNDIKDYLNHSSEVIECRQI